MNLVALGLIGIGVLLMLFGIFSMVKKRKDNRNPIHGQLLSRKINYAQHLPVLFLLTGVLYFN